MPRVYYGPNSPTRIPPALTQSRLIPNYTTFQSGPGLLLYRAHTMRDIVCVSALAELGDLTQFNLAWPFKILSVNPIYWPHLRPAREGEVGIELETGSAIIYRNGAFRSFIGGCMGTARDGMDLPMVPIVKIITYAQDLDLRWMGGDV